MELIDTYILTSIGILQMCLRVSLLGVNEAWKEHWVTNEEDGGIVTDYAT